MLSAGGDPIHSNVWGDAPHGAFAGGNARVPDRRDSRQTSPTPARPEQVRDQALSARVSGHVDRILPAELPAATDAPDGSRLSPDARWRRLPGTLFVASSASVQRVPALELGPARAF